MKIQKHIATSLAILMFLTGCNLQSITTEKSTSLVDKIPDNSFFIAIQNSTLATQKTQALFEDFIKFMEKIPDMTERDLNEIKMVQSEINEILPKIKSVSLFFRANPENFSYEKIKTSIENDTSKDLVLNNNCIIANIDTNMPEINMMLMPIQSAMPEEIEYLTEEDQKIFIIGECSEEDKISASLQKTGATENIILYFDANLRNIYSNIVKITEEEAEENMDEMLELKQMLEPLQEKINRINFIQLTKNIEKFYYTIELTETGFKKEIILSIPNKELREITQNFLEGKAMTKPMVIPNTTEFTSQTKIQDNLVFYEEEYKNVDFGTFFGSIVQFYSNMGIIPIMGLGIGIIGTVSIFQGAQEKARDSVRTSDINAILNAISQYSVDNRGSLPPGINSQMTIISSNMTNGADFCKAIVPNYLSAMPTDPSDLNSYYFNCEDFYTGYTFSYSEEGRITVSAPSAENAYEISITR